MRERSVGDRRTRIGRYLFFIGTCLVLSCGGGGGGGGGVTYSVSGTVMAGRVAGAQVSLYALTAIGAKGDLLGSATTDTAGRWTLGAKNASSSLLVEATGGTFTDEATMAPVSLSTTLRAAVSDFSLTVSAHVTPLTEAAVRQAEAAPGALVRRNILAANGALSTFSGVNITTVEPADVTSTGGAGGMDQDSVDYGLILAGLSQAAQDHSPGTDPVEGILAFVHDAWDGYLDGKDLGTAISLNGSTVAATIFRSGLGQAIATWQADPGKNKSGAAIDATTLSRINSAASGLTPFRTGQSADLALGPHGLEKSGGASSLSFPGRVMWDGSRLFVSDTRNNRVLIWNSWPTQNGQPADVVVGQPDMDSAASGGGRTGLNWPVGVWSDGTRLFVADTNNHRCLIWNQIPTTNGAAADIVVGKTDFDDVNEPPSLSGAADRLVWPWDISTDPNGHLYITDTSQSRVVVWLNWVASLPNPFPAEGMPLGGANRVVGQSGFVAPVQEITPTGMNTPRSAVCNADGTKLVVSDYNAARVTLYEVPDIAAADGAAATAVIGAPDYYSQGGLPGLHATFAGGKLLIADSMVIRVYNTIPSGIDPPLDYVIGRGDYQAALAQVGFNSIWGLSSDGTKLAVAEINNCRVALFDSLPTGSDQPADRVLGVPDFTTNPYVNSNNGVMSTPGIHSNGSQFFHASDAGMRVMVWDAIPSQEALPADRALGRADFTTPPMWPLPIDIVTAQGIWSTSEQLFIADGFERILIYDLPIASFNQAPKVQIGGQAVWPGLPAPQDPNRFSGNGRIHGITTDGTRLVLCQPQQQRILIYNTIPTADKGEDFAIGPTIASWNPPNLTGAAESNSFNMPYYACIVAGKLIVSDAGARRILIWNTFPSDGDTPPDVVLGDKDSNDPTIWMGPWGVYSDGTYLIAGDAEMHRVLVWARIPATNFTPADVVIGQSSPTLTRRASTTRSTFNGPRSVFFDGRSLWVGEFKFGDRTLRFSPPGLSSQ